ncbi:histidine kinase [Staphylococcus aureus]
MKSLQAQASSHFFFNSINTISALVRINSEKARELRIRIELFFQSEFTRLKARSLP